MDEVVSLTPCRQKLSLFRVRELRDVLSRLGLPQQGKKRILMNKILGVLVPAEMHPALEGVWQGVGQGKIGATREECVHIIEDIYNKLRGEKTSARKKDAGAASSSLAQGPGEASTLQEATTRCPCGNSKDQGVMIRCDDSKCGIWQHVNCVVIPEKTVEDAKAGFPSLFYCELCRINRSDPFCLTLHSPLPPTQLSTTKTKFDHLYPGPMQKVERTFQLSRFDRDLLQKSNHDLQVWCLLLNDKVPFRMHWPAYADLRVNGVSMSVTSRPGSHLLGANSRDEGLSIASFTREGLNGISFSTFDARPVVLGVRIIRHNSLQQIFAMIADISAGEDFEEALARTRLCINGGVKGAAGDGYDSDLEVVADSFSVSLRCPISGSRMKVAGRFKPCLHMGCFDLHTFVELNQRVKKWQCPICLKNYALENLIIDPFLSRITTALKYHPEDVTEIEIKADGHWRPKAEKSCKRWHSPDDSLVPRSSLGIGIKRKHYGQSAIDDSVKRVNGQVLSNMAGPSQKAKLAMPAVEAVVISQISSIGADSNEENLEDGERRINQEPSKKDMEAAQYFDYDEASHLPKGQSKGTTWPSRNRSTEPEPVANVIVLSDRHE